MFLGGQFGTWGHQPKPMRNFIAAVATALILAATLSASAQNTAAKTDTTIKIIRASDWQAGFYSRDNKALVIRISTGTKEKLYTAEEYARMLGKMFLDTARTSYPLTPVFFVEDTDKDRNSVTTVYMNGIKFDKNGGEFWGGDDKIHPYDLPGYIRQITAQYASMNGWPMD